LLTFSILYATTPDDGFELAEKHVVIYVHNKARWSTVANEGCLYLLIFYRCFKREFPEAEALKMWEACWANYLTDYFHLFLCLAIISIYSDDVIAQDLRTDEMLLHFSSLAMFMDGELILRKVKIPCHILNLN
jgi:hypothetical protein